MGNLPIVVHAKTIRYTHNGVVTGLNDTHMGGVSDQELLEVHRTLSLETHDGCKASKKYTHMVLDSLKHTHTGINPLKYTHLGGHTFTPSMPKKDTFLSNLSPHI